MLLLKGAEGTLALAEVSLLGPFALRLPRSGHIRCEKTAPKCRREAIPLQRNFCQDKLVFS